MQTLYKFVNCPEAVKSMLNGSIKFTPVAELNDPIELFAHADPDVISKSLKKFRKNGYTEIDLVNLRKQEMLLTTLTPNFVQRSTPNTIEEANEHIQLPMYDSIEVLIDIVKSIRREMLQKTGIFCVSQKNDSFPMWAHYANNAKGFVVEFENLESIFKGDETGVLSQITPIAYNKSPHITFDPCSHRTTFFTKHPDWSYENEYRIVKQLSKCKKTESNGKNLFLSEIPKNLIKRVIIGWNCSSEDRKYVEAITHNVSNAIIDNGKIKIV